MEMYCPEQANAWLIYFLPLIAKINTVRVQTVTMGTVR